MSIFVAVQSDDFCVASEYDELRRQSGCGAIVTFSGLVRELSDNTLHSMTLEHYPGMTEQAVTAIAEQAQQRWQLGAVRIIHRVGCLKPQQQIVFVGIASAHRAAAFAAGEPSTRPDPLVRDFTDYPLHLGRPLKYPNELWAGNEQGLIRFYNQPYVANRSIEFDGMSFQMLGQPASGDTVELHPVTAPTDLFQVMQNAVDALRGASTGQTAQLTQAVGRSLTELDAGHDRVLLARAQAGEWLNRGEAVDGLLSDRMVDHESEKSRLEDLDMIKGISDFQNQQTGLQAALQSYAQVQRLSLFQYIG